MKFFLTGKTEASRAFLCTPLWAIIAGMFFDMVGAKTKHVHPGALVEFPEPKDWMDAQFIFGHIQTLCEKMDLEVSIHPDCVSALPVVDKKFLLLEIDPLRDLPLGQKFSS
jgi:hypothetical protein